MLRVIFDTNIYGFLIKERDLKELEEKIIQNKDFVVYGFSPIRKELRAIPKTSKNNKKARIALLDLYNSLTQGHFLENSIQITLLAKKYYDMYRNYGGTEDWNANMKVDFMIVASASIKQLDIIYSGDEKTLQSKQAIAAYNHINAKEGFRTPNFWGYALLIQKLRGEL